MPAACRHIVWGSRRHNDVSGRHRQRSANTGLAGHGAGTQEFSSATTSGCPHSPGKRGQPFGSVPMFYAQTCAMPKLRRPHPAEPGMGRTGRCRPGNATAWGTVVALGHEHDQLGGQGPRTRRGQDYGHGHAVLPVLSIESAFSPSSFSEEDVRSHDRAVLAPAAPVNRPGIFHTVMRTPTLDVSQ